MTPKRSTTFGCDPQTKSIHTYTNIFINEQIKLTDMIPRVIKPFGKQYRIGQAHYQICTPHAHSRARLATTQEGM